MFPNLDNELPKMSAAEATVYVRKLVDREARGSGDIPRAMERLATRYGIGFWQLSHIRKGKAKSVDVSLYARIRGAYLDYCEREVRALQHELEIEKAMNPHALEDLEDQVHALAAQIATEKKASRSRAQPAASQRG